MSLPKVECHFCGKPTIRFLKEKGTLIGVCNECMVSMMQGNLSQMNAKLARRE